MIDRIKQPRVKQFAGNLQKGESIPDFKNDCDYGNWVDDTIAQRGVNIDKDGTLDIPEFNIDNKSRKKGSKANHTVGSMTIDAIKNTPDFKDTPLWHKVQNQNQIVYDKDFMEISSVNIVDFDIDEIQDRLNEAWEDLQQQVTKGCRDKTIKSSNGWAVFDGYNYDGSYRLRITDKAMKKIHSISGTRDTFLKHFEIEE